MNRYMLNTVVALGFTGTVVAVPEFLGLDSKPFLIGFIFLLVLYTIVTIFNNRTRIPKQQKILSILDSEFKNYKVVNPFHRRFMIDNVDLSSYLTEINNPNIRILHHRSHIFIIESNLPSLSLHDNVILFSVDRGKSWYENYGLCFSGPIYTGKNIAFVVNKLKGEANDKVYQAGLSKKYLTGTIKAYTNNPITRSLKNSLIQIENIDSYTIDITDIDTTRVADFHDLAFHKEKFFEKNSHLKDLPLELIIPLHF